MAVSSVSRLSAPSLSWRLSKASLSGVSTGRNETEYLSSFNTFKKQHPPPQHSFCINSVPKPATPSKFFTSSEFCEMSLVEARLFRGWVTGSAIVSSFLSWSEFRLLENLSEVFQVPQTLRRSRSIPKTVRRIAVIYSTHLAMSHRPTLR